MAQGTIVVYNGQSRSGIIRDDSHKDHAFDFDSFRDSGIREFRLGQRVKFSVEGDTPREKVRNLTIVSF